MIKAQNLNKTYITGGQLIKAVDNVTLSIEKGDFLSIVGHSGSGKTTLLNLLGGLTKPSEGKVEIEGVDLWSINDRQLSKLRNEKINFIYQFASLIPTLSALENVMLPTAFGNWTKNVRQDAEELLTSVGLKDRFKNYPSQLSGGQQRRVAIARAFINDPDIILADEPTGDLDEETEADIFDLFDKFNQEKQTTFILVTHNEDLAGRTKRQVKMTHGVLENF